MEFTDVVLLWILITLTMVGPIENAVCSVGCPPDHYEVKPCTNFGDRICEPCRKCEGSTYEIKPCSLTSNRHCIHAAHPLLMEDKDNMPTFLEGLRVDASPNVIIEDLHNTHDLVTTFYLADRKQASDFKWSRDSGLVVNIGILNVHLTPQYEDVSHESDNRYMLNDPSNSQDKTKFKAIVDKYCRNPIPDQYSITLEISRDRTTKAAMETCDSRNPALPACPKGRVNGDTYLHRTLNDPCVKMGTFPEPLQPAANCVVCTEQTALLSEVFNRSYTEERPIRFPSWKCKTAQSRCQQCMQQAGCKALELFESKCCRVDCYTLPFCKTAMSHECTGTSVECAMGDAYRYTIQPVFQKIKTEFRCHIKHKPSDILYQIFFNLEMPGTGWATKPVYRTVYAKDLNYESHGEFQSEYLSIEHNTGIDLKEEFILIGQDLENPTAKEKMSYSIQRLKSKEDFAKHKKRALVHSIDHTIYVASTEFTRPFDYSTTSWVKNNECHKDVSKFNFHDPEYNARIPRQPVKVDIQSNQDHQPFKYWIQGTNSQGNANAPFIRFTVPGNMSILPWYFKQGSGKQSQLLIDDHFQVELELTPGDKIWNIHMQGRLDNCPGYLGIVINDREEMEELIKHDLLILCPSTFNLTFHIPNFGQKLDKTFDIHLEDSAKIYHTFLTQLKVGPDHETTEPEPVILLEAKQVSYTSFLVIAGVALLTVVILNKVYIYTEVMRAKKKVFHSAKRHTASHLDSLCSDPHNQDDGDITCGKHMNKGQMIFLILYVVLRVVYSLLFTFTVFFAILMIFIRSDLNNLSKIDDFVQTAKNESERMSHDIDRHWRVELLRQAEKVTEMQGACSNYVTELFDSMAFQMNNITSNYYNQELYGSKTSLSYLMNQRAKFNLNKLNKEIANYSKIHKDMLTTAVAPYISKYSKYLKLVFQNDWLSFGQKLFNASYSSQYSRRSPHIKDSLLVNGVETDFLRFLEVEDVEFVRMWALRYWQKYEQMLPDFPSLPVPQIGPHNIHCLPNGHKDDYNITRQPSITHMDTVKFFAPNLPADVDKGPVYHHGNIRQEYKFVTQPSTTVKKSKEPLATEELEITNMVNTEVLSIIFLILDAILLLYRFSHTYLNAAVIVRGFNEEISKQQIEEQEYYTRPVMPAVTASTPVTAKYKQTRDYSHIPLGQPNVDTSSYQYDYHGNGPSFHGNGMGTKQPNSSSNNGGSGADGMYYISGGRTDLCKILIDTLAKIVLSLSLPKVLIGCCLLVLVYGIMRVVSVVAEMKFLLDTNLLGVYTSGMDVQINQTNWYLADQAGYFNHVSMDIYQGQMTSELKYLQSMLQYFDLEQKRLVENYRAEGCNISQHETGGSNWTCDITIQPPTLNIPLLPCNFVPVMPSPFSVLAPLELEQRLVKTLEVYIISSRHVTMVITYIIFIAMASMLTIHVVGVVVFHVIKSSNRFTARRVYVTSYLPPGGASGVDEMPPPPTEESDYESDEIEGGTVWSQTLPKHKSCDNERYMRTYPSPARGRPNPEPTGTLLSDFKYSETKV